MKMKNICKGIAFFLVLIVVFLTVQEILTPEFNSDGMNAKVISGMYALDKDTLDVLFLGTSFMARGVSPMTLYEQTYIRGYNLSTSGQPIQGSYYLLREALQRQKPQYVILDISRMFSHNETSYPTYLRYIIDNMRLGRNKLELQKVYESMAGNDEGQIGLFPIIKYHTRWDELSKQDFETGFFAQEYETMGQACYPYFGTAISVDEMEQLWHEEATEIGVVGEDTTTTSSFGLEVDPVFIEYFQKMNQLCKEKGITLVATKLPVQCRSVEIAWNSDKTNLAKRFLESYGVGYLDLITPEVIDPAKDYHDSGTHLNPSGADKMSTLIGEYLLKQMDLSERGADQQYERCLEKYKVVANVSKINLSSDFESYLEALVAIKDKLTICISSYDEYTNGLSENEKNLLQQLGLQEITKGVMRDGYAAVIDGGSVVYEALNHDGVSTTMKLRGKKLTVSGSGYDNPKLSSKIEVDGTNYSLKMRGLNIAVFSHDTMELINTTVFDTFEKGARFFKQGDQIGLYYEYYFKD